jgi:hypothetical protein
MSSPERRLTFGGQRRQAQAHVCNRLLQDKLRDLSARDLAAMHAAVNALMERQAHAE